MGVPAATEGESRYLGGSFQMRDALGVFNPRYAGQGGLPSPPGPGGVLISPDGIVWQAAWALTSQQGWLVNDEGLLLVSGG